MRLAAAVVAVDEESIFARAKGHRRRQLGRRGIGERIVRRPTSRMRRRESGRREGESKSGPTTAVV